jgi:hypothetical protein
MERRTIAQRLAQREVRMQSQQARLSKRVQAREIRRKIVLGAFILHHVRTNADTEIVARLRDWLRRDLLGFLTHDGDKNLFRDLLDQDGHAGNAAEDQQ